MGHAQMLKTRRAKQSNRKQLARIAKQAKKMRQRGAKTAGADPAAK